MSYFLRRAAFLLLTLWVAVTINFLIPRLMPGNPAAAVVSKLTGKGQGANPEALRAVEAMLGMPEGNLFQQYGQYLSSLARGDFGVSYAYFPYSVLDMIAGALPWTLALIGVTSILAFVIGTTIGAFAAWRRSGVFDSVATLTFTFAGTLPFFWVGLIGLYFLGFVLGWFPLSGGLRRLTRARLERGFRRQRTLSQRPARRGHTHHFAGRLDHGHAQQHDPRVGRGLHPSRPGKGSEVPGDSPELRSQKRDPAQHHRIRHRLGPGGGRLSFGRGRVRLPWHGQPALQGGSPTRTTPSCRQYSY